ncbi:EpsG family protein [Marinobacterium maritimum]|uniref:EpsG family protein n=1 Tax=Marinobacterium maritimum TaxID=500162 RepID=UPI0031DF0D29
MTTYFLFYMTLFVLQLLAFRVKSNFFYISAILLVVAFVSLRYMVGWDYEHYYNAIVYHADNNITLREEYLTVFLIDLARIYESPFIYFFINAAIFFSIFYFFVKKYSVNPWLSLFIFIGFPLFFLNSLSVVRTFTAISVSLLALCFLLNKRYIVYLALIFLASLFHKSAFIALFLPIFLLVDFNKKLWAFVIVFGFLAGSYIEAFIGYLVEIYFPYYQVYLKKTMAQEGTKAIFFLAGFAVLFVIFSDKITKNDKAMSFFLDSYLFGVFIYMIFANYGTLAHRATLYSTVLLVILLPRFLEVLRPLYINRILFFSLHAILIFFFFYTVKVGEDTYIPYRFIF